MILIKMDVKILFCPYCNEPMMYHEEQDFHTCLNGCCEVWPKHVDTTGLFYQEIRDKKKNISKHGGGNKAAGRKRDKKIIKKRFTIYI